MKIPFLAMTLSAATALAMETPVPVDPQGGGDLRCRSSYVSKRKVRDVPGLAIETPLSEQKMELTEGNRDVEFLITIDPAPAGGKSPDRPFRIVLRNKRSDLIGHLDGGLAMLRHKEGATLRLQAPEGVNSFPETREIRVNCLIH